jgi:hypothetical protein
MSLSGREPPTPCAAKWHSPNGSMPKKVSISSAQLPPALALVMDLHTSKTLRTGRGHIKHRCINSYYELHWCCGDCRLPVSVIQRVGHSAYQWYWELTTPCIGDRVNSLLSPCWCPSCCCNAGYALTLFIHCMQSAIRVLGTVTSNGMVRYSTIDRHYWRELMQKQGKLQAKPWQNMAAWKKATYFHSGVELKQMVR